MHTCTEIHTCTTHRAWIHKTPAEKVPKKEREEKKDTIECLSMQETLSLVGRRALKEFAQGSPTSP